MEPRKRIKLGRKPIQPIPGWTITLVDIHRGEVTLDIEAVGERSVDIDDDCRNLDTKPATN